MLYLDPAALKALKRYALDQNTKVHSLLLDAAEAWFKSHELMQQSLIDSVRLPVERRRPPIGKSGARPDAQGESSMNSTSSPRKTQDFEYRPPANFACAMHPLMGSLQSSHKRQTPFKKTIF